MSYFKQEIEDLIEERKEKYRKRDGNIDCDEIKATFNREKETTSGYNGRQLLELIQNADDAKSDKIYINLNTEQQILTIANKGKNCEPFNIDGIKSLLLANLSSKDSNNYIGNKGLGFRSVINWSDEIIINSNNLDISFSQDIAVNAFKDSGLNKNELPILAIPKLTENTQTEWTTRISIKYKYNFLDDIKEQIQGIKPEILLFLNHLTAIEIDINGDEEKINKPIWTIKSKTDYFKEKSITGDDDKETGDDDKDIKYEIKIAFNNELTNNVSEYLFSYFPTNIKISTPFIVHGTFDLDSTRNQLNTTDKNKFILKELVKLIIETAKGLSENNVSYKALSFLNYSQTNEVLDGLGFYNEINSAIDELEIYPCLGGGYRKKNGIVYNNDLSLFVKNTNFCNLLPYLLIPTDDENIIKILDSNKLLNFSCFNNSRLINNINRLNKEIKNVDDRVDFIHLLIKNNFTRQLPLLIDEDENLIIGNDDIYTPSNKEFSLPDYVNIKFVNKTLYKSIHSYWLDKLKNITNLKECNKTEILRKVITSTNKELKKENVENISCIKEMIKCLYSNYDKDITIKEQNIQLLNKNQQLQNANDLYLSETYPSGELTEELFGDTFADSNFLADIDDFNLEGNKQIIEVFFIWLGVNINTKFQMKSLNHNSEYWMYIQPDEYIKQHDEYMIQHEQEEISKFDLIKEISREKFIVWIIRCNIDIGTKFIGFEGPRGGLRDRRIISVNYISFQLKSSNIFKDYLLDSKIGQLVNDNPINYNHQLFKKYNIHREDINSILLKIGAVDKFSELSEYKKIEVLKSLPEKDSQGKLSQKIYLEIFKQNSEYIGNNIPLFAKKNYEGEYLPQEDVYYAGNVKLPKEYTKQLSIFDYPKRKRQEAEKIISYFGINDLSAIQPNIKNKTSSNIDNEFQTHFEKIKPYILAYRLENVEKDEKTYAETLSGINIKLYGNLICEIDNQEYELADYDYLIDDENKEYLIKVPDYKLDIIRQKYDFYTTFGNIFGLIFDLNNTHKFKDCIKDSEENIKLDINDNISRHAINDAKELLGIASNDFWQTIYKILGKEYTNQKHDEINKELGISIDKNIDYADLLNIETLKNIIILFKKLSITIQDFNENAYYKIDFSKYRHEKLESCFNDNKNKFKKCLHQDCQKNNKQSEYLDKLKQYQTPENNYKTELEVNYQQVCNDFIKDKFSFELIEIDNLNIDAIYKKNKKQINYFEIIENDDKIRSLLYFDGFIEKVNKYITEKKLTDQPKEQTNQKSITEIKPAVLETTPSAHKLNKNNYTQSYYQQNRQKANAGNNAEQKVFDFLNDKYGIENVNWVSQDQSNADHDFEYKDKDGKWWYVEVKTLSNNMFCISKNEKNFAERNSDSYKIFLVGDDEIKEIFPVNFEDDKFVLEAKTFSVQYKLKTD